MQRERVDLPSLFRQEKWVSVCAPMVRYSKLPFRLLVKEYGVKVSYTPMMLADSFIYSNYARDMEFQLCSDDQPVVIQFGARNAFEFASAAELASPYVDGIDLNCGCPQRWAFQEGIGAKLMHVDPEHLKDMIRQAVGRSVHTPISVKIRIYEDRRRTVELARQIESMGAAWVTVHGRRKEQKSSEKIDPESIKLVKEALNIPVIANGNIFSLEEAEELHASTKADGIMSARGLLENPALFAGCIKTPWSAVNRYVELALQYGSCHAIMHHHLSTMMGSLLPSSLQRQFNTLSSIPSIIDFINELQGQ